MGKAPGKLEQIGDFFLKKSSIGSNPQCGYLLAEEGLKKKWRSIPEEQLISPGDLLPVPSEELAVVGSSGALDHSEEPPHGERRREELPLWDAPLERLREVRVHGSRVQKNADDGILPPGELQGYVLRHCAQIFRAIFQPENFPFNSWNYPFLAQIMDEQGSPILEIIWNHINIEVIRETMVNMLDRI